MAEKPEITKRKVTLKSIGYAADGTRVETIIEDYLRPDILDAYVASRREAGWHVEVSEKPDAGPGGYEGATYVPDDIIHPLAGQTFDAIEKVK